MEDTPFIEVSVEEQKLRLFDAFKNLVRVYPVSTARNGTGCEEGSHCTPLGRFRIEEKIGDGQPRGTIFRGRKPVGQWKEEDPEVDDDLILSRILWLQGEEAHNADTRDRYIYIHGTNQESLIGEAVSHGCVRMRNEDVIDLFDRIPEGVPLTIA